MIWKQGYLLRLVRTLEENSVAVNGGGVECSGVGVWGVACDLTRCISLLFLFVFCALDTVGVAIFYLWSWVVEIDRGERCPQFSCCSTL